MNSNVENMARVNACKNLDDLCDELNRIDAIVEGDDDTPGDPFAAVDTTELPTFGGRKPESTEGIYSWDKTRLLVPANDGSWEVVTRRWYYGSKRDDAADFDEK